MDRITKYIIFGSIVLIILTAIGLVVLVLGNRKQIDPDDVLGQNAKEIALSDVQKNNSVKSCWTIVGGNVYDATGVIAANNDLQATLVKACGGDGTDYYTIKKFSKQELTNEQINKLFNQLQQKRVGIIAPE